MNQHIDISRAVAAKRGATIFHREGGFFTTLALHQFRSFTESKILDPDPSTFSPKLGDFYRFHANV